MTWPGHYRVVDIRIKPSKNPQDKQAALSRTKSDKLAQQQQRGLFEQLEGGLIERVVIGFVDSETHNKNI